jgi:DNA-binding transcriptional LysR family regulator
MTEPLNWDEYRIVRAIAEAQSLSGAADRLGLNHSTLFRRLAAMETALGLKLFERERAGYRPTAAGEDMVALATLMGDTIAEFERRVGRNEVALSGRVRVTTINCLGALMFPSLCARLAEIHPGLHVELMLSDSLLDLERGDADIALRGLTEAPPEGLTGREVAPIPWAIYAVPALTTPAGEPAADAPWVVPTDSVGPPQVRRWLDRHVEAQRRRASAANEILMADLAARGVGVALLPCFVGVARPQLRRVGAADADLTRGLWVVARTQALRAGRVRAVFNFFCEELERRRAWFEGKAVVGE